MLRYGTPWLSVETDPPGEENGGSGSAPNLETLQQQLSELQQKTSGQQELIEKLRGFERQYKSLEAIVGETNPDRLQQLREAESKLKEAQAAEQQKILDARNAAADEYTGQITKLTTQLSEAQQKAAQVETTYELFQAFNGNGGIGDRFQGFVGLAGGNFERDNNGKLQVRDDAGNLVVFKPKEGPDRVASPAEFIKMLGANQLEGYQFNQLSMLQLTLEAYNKSSGSGLPGDNGIPVGVDIHKMSQANLGEMAFKP